MISAHYYEKENILLTGSRDGVLAVWDQDFIIKKIPNVLNFYPL